MFTELYMEAVLADPERADRVWELWNAEIITDGVAAWAWLGIIKGFVHNQVHRRTMLWFGSSDQKKHKGRLH